MTTPVHSAPSEPAFATQPVCWWRHPARRPPAPAPWLHDEVARRMATRLDVIRPVPHLMVDIDAWRSGSAELLRARYPKAAYWRVAPDEGAAAAVRASGKRPWWRPAFGSEAASHRVLGEAALDAESSTEPVADLLWANMVLHTRVDPAATLRQWLHWLKVDGFLMFSCLGPDSLRELNATHATHGWGQACQPWIDMHDLGDELVRAGFADPVMDMERITLTYADAQRLTSDLRALGPNRHAARHAGLRTPAWRERWWHALQADAGGDRVHITIEVIYGHAFKSAPRLQVAPETSVELGAMRRMLRGGGSR